MAGHAWFAMLHRLLRLPAGWRDLRYLFLYSAVVAAALSLLDAMLVLPSGYGIDDFLGWRDAAAYGAMAGRWRDAGVGLLPYLYLLIDTAVFPPVYSALLLALVLRYAEAVANGSPLTQGAGRWLLLAGAAPTAALVCADLAENAGGFARLGAWGLACALAACAVALVLLAFSRTWRRLWALLHVWWAVAAVLLLLGSMAGRGWPAGADLASLGAAAHAAKSKLMVLALGVAAALPAMWFFGWRLTGAGQGRAQRAATRAAVFDMLKRTRYVNVAVLLALGLLMSDQARDVLYAMAQSLAGGSLLALLWLALTLVAAWLLSFACWLWARGACLIGSAAPVAAGAAQDATVQAFGRHWPRLLGMAPYVLLLLLCRNVIQDAVSAGGSASAWWGAVLVVLAFSFACAVTGWAFLHGRAVQQPLPDYYSCMDWKQWSAMLGLGAVPDRRYRMAGRVPPLLLPVLTLLFLMLCRGLDARGWTGGTTLVLPVMLLSIALWLAFFGWLSVLEIQRAVPWVLGLLVVVAVFGVLGASHNHLVPSPRAQWPSGRQMWLGTLGLALVVMAGYGLMLSLVRQSVQGRAPGWKRAIAAVLAVYAGLLGALAVADRAAAEDAPSPMLADQARPPVHVAMGGWLRTLCKPRERPDGPCTADIPAGKSLDVFFVSTEGGGIRAAAWTAFVLDELAGNSTFVQRTFSVSGVSGGSVGAAAFRACALSEDGKGVRDPKARRECLQAWSHADHLSALLGAWMFEDALARVLPTSLCATPGCGAFSRGAWFEHAMRDALPRMDAGLVASGQALRGAAHHPYLFLNATWVESGERAIASDAQAPWDALGTARDQLRIVGHDLPLASAAHNSARFPFVNAVGALKADPRRCRDRRLDAPYLPGAPAPAEGGREEVCGYLVDGGYFDNSGAQTTLDLLAVLGRCLAPRVPGQADLGCGLTEQQRAWLHQRLVPTVLMIHNSVEAAGVRAQCPDPKREAPPGVADIVPPAPASCTGRTPEAAPDRPVCRSSALAGVDALGPALALLNVSGIGAGGRLAESRQAVAVRVLRQALGEAARGSARAPVLQIDLLPDGVHYPLGWHLSPQVAGKIEGKARECGLPAQLDAPPKG